MNRLLLPSDIDPLAHPLDAILADIAVNIQLPPSLFEKATGRYEAVRDYAQRDGSPLRGRILRFYPQGSMSIDATISNRGTDDEYDLDMSPSSTSTRRANRTPFSMFWPTRSTAIQRARRSTARPVA